MGSAVIPDNDDRDDDKVYFFFTERETDGEGVNRGVITRIGRVCAVRMSMPYKSSLAKNSQLTGKNHNLKLLHLSE